MRFVVPTLLVVFGLGLAESCAAEPNQPRPQPTAAFVDVDRSAVGALLETELLGHDTARWLERTEIDSVLKEHKLDSLFGAGATSERSSIGKLLKADLLVRNNEGSAV